jgi:archaellum component FlaC
MNKKTKNVFEKVEELMTSVLEELQTANSMLYAIGSELFDVGDKIDSLSAKVEQLATAPLKVEVDYEKLADAIIMALGYTMRQEVETPKISLSPTKKAT